MDNTGMTPADMAAVMNNNNDLGGNCGAWWIIILFLFVFMGGNGFGFNRNFGNVGEFGQYATAASQQQILFGQQFGDLDNKIDRIGNGICDSTYALNNAITGEGRALQTMGYQNALASQSAMFGLQTQLSDQHAALAAAIHLEGETTRQLLNAQETQRLRDELCTAKDAIINNQQSNYILQQMGRWYANPPCYGCGCHQQNM